MATNGSQVCVESERCLADCAANELCDSSHRCTPPKECQTTKDCGGQTCKVYVEGGSKTCQPPSECIINSQCSQDEFCSASNTCQSEVYIVSKAPSHNKTNLCGTNEDCEMVDTQKPVCMEKGGFRICVEQEQCFSHCSANEICDSNHRCRPPKKCNIAKDCDSCESVSIAVTICDGNTCKAYVEGGSKTCQPHSECNSKTKCASGEFCSAENTCHSSKPPTDYVVSSTKPPPTYFVSSTKPPPTYTLPKSLSPCGTNQDCQLLLSSARPVCMQKNGIRVCVEQKECFSYCLTNQLCDSNQKCLTPKECETSLDCDTKNCKETVEGGSKTCLPPADCTSKRQCSSDEFCSVENICQASQAVANPYIGITSKHNTNATCITVGGAKVGVPCVFPFIYANHVFTGCTGMWCATDTSPAGQLVDGMWGLCPPVGCPMDNLGKRVPTNCLSGKLNI